MFTNCNALETVKFASNATASANNMKNMFLNCESLGKNTPVDEDAIDGIKTFSTSKVKYMDGMFYGCSHLKSLDLRSFDTTNVTTSRKENTEPFKYALDMFNDCVRLGKIQTYSQYNSTKYFKIEGWTLNFYMSGLYS